MVTGERKCLSERSWLVLAATSVLVVVSVTAAVGWFVPASLEQRGQFGDSFGFATSLFTGLGLVGLAASLLSERRKLRSERKAAKDLQLASFENELNREYRQLVGELPPTAFLPDPSRASEEPPCAGLAKYYRYFDLCNSQMFFRQQERVSLRTWSTWCEGILDNMRLRGFQDAWREVKRRRATDEEGLGARDGHLRMLEELMRRSQTGEDPDPAHWPRPLPSADGASRDGAPRTRHADAMA